MDNESEKQYLVVQYEPEQYTPQISNRRNLCPLALKVCCSRYFLKALFLGQFISLLLCGTALRVSSTTCCYVWCSPPFCPAANKGDHSRRS
ncbi:hypothetical protein DPMN_050995 [Dreissena polymorpha]|uniref:Uncharacterized protein n=1 Tax=Dreissena polymorpha TaxID=45954 RepID=A0A9D4CHS9_DREPO|nr:hypothetical protein DPMN_050995 [Dreissena polymorpha]